MKSLAIFIKAIREQLREWASLSMVLVLCPFFVFLYWVMSGGGSTTYKVLLINHDQGYTSSAGATVEAGNDILHELQSMSYESGAAVVTVTLATDRLQANDQLKNRYAAALLVIPARFSQALFAQPPLREEDRPSITLVGDAANPAYTVASVLVMTAVDQVIQKSVAVKSPITWSEEFVTRVEPRTEFEMYVPGLLILSIIMLVFTTALSLVREREERTLRRLILSRMRAFDLFAGITLAQILIGMVAILLTFATAMALGFRSEGSLIAALIIAGLTALSVIAVGLLTACFCRNATAVLTIGTLPFFLLMWFTGAAMPLPRKTLFTIGMREFAVNDILPPTHAVIALNKIVSFGEPLAGVWPEMLFMILLTVLYFAVAVWVYQRTQLRRY